MMMQFTTIHIIILLLYWLIYPHLQQKIYGNRMLVIKCLTSVAVLVLGFLLGLNIEEGLVCLLAMLIYERLSVQGQNKIVRKVLLYLQVIILVFILVIVLSAV